jgi:rubrerythrin
MQLSACQQGGHPMTDAIKQKALKSLSALSTAINSAIDARSYALSCFHQPDQYWADTILRLITETREHLDRAEAILTAPDTATEEEPANV